MTTITDALENAAGSTLDAASAEVVAALIPRDRKGITYEKWPFRLDISTEYQDWILVCVTFVLLSVWCLPCICGRFKNRCGKAFTSWVYTRLHTFFIVVTYLNLGILMFTITILPDWTLNEYGVYFLECVSWVLVHLKKLLTSIAILAVFYLAVKFRDRIAMAAGLEHVTVFRFNWRDIIGIQSKQRPIEVFIWKVEDLASSAGKVFKANDVFIECHMGYNEPMRTRVHNNAGSSAMIKESFQINISDDLDAMMTLQVKDQALMGSSEIGKLNLSAREVFGIEDQTGKRRSSFSYCEECFVELNLIPRGRIWIAIAPVDDIDEERAPLIGDEDSLVTC